MRSRRLILGLIILTLLATCLTAAAKLRATPKYDRVQVGMSIREAEALMGPHVCIFEPVPGITLPGLVLPDAKDAWECDEGTIVISLKLDGDRYVVAEKALIRRGPLDRLAWLAGWR